MAQPFQWKSVYDVPPGRARRLLRLKPSSPFGEDLQLRAPDPACVNVSVQFHSFGVPMRLLGHVRSNQKCTPALRQLLLREMLSRTLKSIVRASARGMLLSQQENKKRAKALAEKKSVIDSKSNSGLGRGGSRHIQVEEDAASTSEDESEQQEEGVPMAKTAGPFYILPQSQPKANKSHPSPSSSSLSATHNTCPASVPPPPPYLTPLLSLSPSASGTPAGPATTAHHKSHAPATAGAGLTNTNLGEALLSRFGSNALTPAELSALATGGVRKLLSLAHPSLTATELPMSVTRQLSVPALERDASGTHAFSPVALSDASTSSNQLFSPPISFHPARKTPAGPSRKPTSTGDLSHGHGHVLSPSSHGGHGHDPLDNSISNRTISSDICLNSSGRINLNSLLDQKEKDRFVLEGELAQLMSSALAGAGVVGKSGKTDQVTSQLRFQSPSSAATNMALMEDKERENSSAIFTFTPILKTPRWLQVVRTQARFDALRALSVSTPIQLRAFVRELAVVLSACHKLLPDLPDYLSPQYSVGGSPTSNGPTDSMDEFVPVSFQNKIVRMGRTCNAALTLARPEQAGRKGNEMQLHSARKFARAAYVAQRVHQPHNGTSLVFLFYGKGLSKCSGRETTPQGCVLKHFLMCYRELLPKAWTVPYSMSML
eukprot:g10133.t1